VASQIPNPIFIIPEVTSQGLCFDSFTKNATARKRIPIKKIRMTKNTDKVLNVPVCNRAINPKSIKNTPFIEGIQGLS
jgi:hypothetical protein